MKQLINHLSTNAKLRITFTYLIIFVFFIGQDCFAQSSTFTDSRDGKTYRTVTLNGKTWMASNLNYETETGSFYYQNNVKYKRAGRLYTFAAAKNACPEGWRLPTTYEWEELTDSYGGLSASYSALAFRGSTGFNAIWAGIGNGNGKFGSKTKVGNYWTSTKHSQDRSKAWGIKFVRAEQVIKKKAINKTMAMSCRCIKGKKKEVVKKAVKKKKTEVLVCDKSDGPGEYTFKMENNSIWDIRFRVMVNDSWSKWEYINSKGGAKTKRTTKDYPFEFYEIEYKDLLVWKSVKEEPRLDSFADNSFSVIGDLFSGLDMTSFYVPH